MYVLSVLVVRNDNLLARAQKEHHEKKERAKLARTQIDFVGSSASKRSISVPATSTGTIILTIRAIMRCCE